MAPNKMDFNFEQVSFNPFKSSDDKTFQGHRDPDLNYFDETKIQNKKNIFK